MNPLQREFLISATTYVNSLARATERCYHVANANHGCYVVMRPDGEHLSPVCRPKTLRDWALSRTAEWIAEERAPLEVKRAKANAMAARAEKQSRIAY